MTLKNMLLRAVMAIIALHVLVILAPLSPHGILFSAVIATLFLLPDYRNSMLLIISLLLLILIMEAIVRLTGDKFMTPYYRAHEILAEETRYSANKRIEMTEAHGDLLAIDTKLDRNLAIPKDILFQTDSRGFRNTHELEQGQLILVGDSYVVGIGNTQKNTITSLLSRNYGIPTYNMGFPAGPFQYANTIIEARSELGSNACIVAVMFEGNDFQIINQTELQARRTVPKGAQKFVKAYFGAIKDRFEISKILFGLVSRSIEQVRQSFGDTPSKSDTANEVTITRHISGKHMIFLKGYVDVVMRESYDDFGYIQEQFDRSKPDLLVFAPAKYRIYGPLLDDEPAHDLPNAQLEHLSSVTTALGIPLLDLTNVLGTLSVEMLAKDLLIYWQDDTHWNQFGIDAASAAIASFLSSHHKPECRQLVQIR